MQSIPITLTGYLGACSTENFEISDCLRAFQRYSIYLYLNVICASDTLVNKTLQDHLIMYMQMSL